MYAIILIRAFIYKKRSGYAEARPLEILEECSHATAPRCEHFEHCGGCTFQQLNDFKQVEQKQRQTIDALKRLEGMEGIQIYEIIQF